MREQTMKTHLPAILTGLAISSCLPTFAQQSAATSTPVPIITPETSTSALGPVYPKIRQQIEAIDQKFDEAFDKHDGTAIAALFTEDAVLITPHEVFSGREAIEKRFKSILEGSSFSDHVSKLDQVETAFGAYTWAAGNWTVKTGSGTGGGFRVLFYLPEGGEWKISKEVAFY
jgi:uncharacterized protein (TIGR02246 family)